MIEFCIELLVTKLLEAFFYIVVLVLDDNGSIVRLFNDNFIIISE